MKRTLKTVLVSALTLTLLASCHCPFVSTTLRLVPEPLSLTPEEKAAVMLLVNSRELQALDKPIPAYRLKGIEKETRGHFTLYKGEKGVWHEQNRFDTTLYSDTVLLMQAFLQDGAYSLRFVASAKTESKTIQFPLALSQKQVSGEQQLQQESALTKDPVVIWSFGTGEEELLTLPAPGTFDPKGQAKEGECVLVMSLS